jgi:hypothetical protein
LRLDITLPFPACKAALLGAIREGPVLALNPHFFGKEAI